MSKSNYSTLIGISIIMFLVSGCKPGDYTYRVATGNTPEDTARGLVIQATADSAKETRSYESALHDLDVWDRTQQADLRQEAMRSNIQNEITTTLITAQAKRQVIVERGQAEADSIRAVGKAAAIAVTSLSVAASAIMFTASVYLMIILALKLWIEWRRVPIAENTWQIIGPSGLPSNFILLKDGNRLFIQDILTGERSDVRRPAQVNAIRAQLLIAAKQQNDARPGILTRITDYLFRRRDPLRVNQKVEIMEVTK
jgi:hypothetical protein